MSTIEQQARTTALPEGATDCHSHVVGPVDRWPMIADRRYEPEQGPVADYIATLAGLGLDRCVLVQPSIYGTDNGCQIEAMQEIGRDRCRGVAVVSPDVANAELQRLHDAGMRGVRFNLRSGGLGIDDLETVCRKIAPFGWHAQIFTAAPVIAEREMLLRRLPVPVVVDHMGGPDPAEGLGQPGFRALLRLLADRVAWVKLSGAERLSGQETGYDDVVPFARALIAAAPERAVWGIDWPPSRFYKVQPEPGDWIKQLLKYVEQPAGLVPVLRDNPAALYGFPARSPGKPGEHEKPARAS
ncbi:MAG TPA: amidohydrolase family protein [Stellaceae bacterium]|nr:amidohydrolase family protein [Stellaceae bacterium]